MDLRQQRLELVAAEDGAGAVDGASDGEAKGFRNRSQRGKQKIELLAA